MNLPSILLSRNTLYVMVRCYATNIIEQAVPSQRHFSVLIVTRVLAAPTTVGTATDAKELSHQPHSETHNLKHVAHGHGRNDPQLAEPAAHCLFYSRRVERMTRSHVRPTSRLS